MYTRCGGAYLLSFIRTTWRIVVVVVTFVLGAVELMITRPKTRPQRAAWLSRFCARLLKRMGVTLSTEGPVPQSGAVISNHLTFIDILVHGALHPCVFVSKEEVRNIPLAGWMSMMAGTIYVARGRGGSAGKAAEVMAKGFRDGLPVVFFPEGTTGTGEETLLPFRSGLLAQTLDAGAPVSVAFLSYALSARDQAEGKTLRNDLHWGAQPMTTMIWRFCSLHGLHAKVRFAELPMTFSEKAMSDRKTAAIEAREAMLRLAQAPGSWEVPQS